MSPIEKAGIINSIVDLILLAVAIMLFPVTKNVLILGIPVMGWGFLILSVIFIIQVYVYVAKAEAYEKMNGGK